MTIYPVDSPQLRGFYKGLAFPVLITGLANSAIFGSYGNALDYLTQSRRGDRVNGKDAPAAHVFAAGCFSGLVGVMETLRMPLCCTTATHLDLRTMCYV